MSVTSNRLKFRVWDNKALYQALEQATQIEEKVLEQLAGDSQDIYVSDLPHSVIPTEVLYNLAISYTEAYNKLLEYNLVTCGYPKATTTQH